jgi:phosphoribosyl-ATP pyrophosphohydrolase
MLSTRHAAHNTQSRSHYTTSLSSLPNPSDRPSRSFVEETARQGAQRIAQLSVQERTQRAMLAEAVEDQMILLEEELETLWNTRVDQSSQQPTLDDKDVQVKDLVQEIQRLRDQYQTLVTGQPFAMLNIMKTALNDTNDSPN